MNSKKYTLLFLVIILLQSVVLAQVGVVSGQVLDQQTNIPIANASVFLENKNEIIKTNSNGEFEFNQVTKGDLELTIYKENYATKTELIIFEKEVLTDVIILLGKLNLQIDEVEITAKSGEDVGLRKLNNVEGTAIYAAKKSEVIELENIVANQATNNARQVYKAIAGVNVWESDGAGLQLSIGARGLDPNRTSNFNTRQNGYDISADALGYPESYYTPPVQALQRIEIVRGAASLQYGSQFGGLLNFVFKKGNKKKPIEFISENTVGSFGLVSSFNSLGGEKNGWNYYTFYQRKQGDGWRDFSKFEQNTAFASVSKSINKNLKIGVEYTFMNYIAQQAGGLKDFDFAQNPQQSLRTRNWFKVNWNLAALTLDYKISDKTKLNSRSFFLAAQRDALGELGRIDRPDPMRDRDLIRGNYNNFGNETRLITRYDLGEQTSTFLIGARYYQGFTTNEQGDADATSDANFTFLNPTDLEKSAYDFPSKNIAVFAENLFNINENWTITPGVRFEYIKTASEGFYKKTFIVGGQIQSVRRFEDSMENPRSLVLLGLGVGHKISENTEAYANFSQNYRSINFSDLAVVNPNLIVDSLLQDEKGFNTDLGIRGSFWKNKIKIDASIFYLRYQNRIGIGEIIIEDPVVIEKAVAFRTNIGDARILGLESYLEADLLDILNKKTKYLHLSIFTNLSLIHGKYLSGQSFVIGKNVELIPPINLKTGLNFRWKKFKASYQFTFVGEHFSDATNAEFVSDATRGTIPSYQVQDLSFSYTWNRFQFQSGINNLTNESYFTRRAVGYPGPGIIPSDARSFYGTIAIKF
ncbi:MAG: TonB-dependent receptor [Saprospiraceae bacterium]